MSVDVEHEQAQAPRVGAAAIAAGVLLLLGALYLQFAVAPNVPTISLLHATTPALQGMPATGPSPHTATEVFLNKHALGFVLAALISGIGTALIAVPLRHLFFAARARREGLGGIGLVVGTYGPLLVGLLGILFQVVYSLKLHSFVHSGDHSQHAIDRINNSTPLVVAGLFGFAAHFAIAFAFVIVPLNAMRAGLLSRFMGVLGIICGVIFIFQQLAPLPVVQAFWLIALGVLFTGRGPQGLPPAWAAGKAMPWPSQQELREARAGGTAAAVAAPAPAPVAPPVRTNPNASKKRKRKRR